MVKRILIAVGVGILAWGCGGGGESADPLPLAVGNWWKYEDDSGKVILDTIVAEVGGRYKMLLKAENETDTAYLYYDEGGYLHYLILTFDIKMFKQDPQVGDEWDAWTSESTEDMDGDEVVDTIRYITKRKIVGQEDVEVPAGSFESAYKVHELNITESWFSTSGQWTYDTSEGSYDWWAVGVGVIKSADSDGSTTSQLIDYHVE